MSKSKLFIKEIKQAANDAGITHAKIAELTGFLAPNVTRMLNNRNSIKLENILKLAFIVGLDLEFSEKDYYVGELKSGEYKVKETELLSGYNLLEAMKSFALYIQTMYADDDGHIYLDDDIINNKDLYPSGEPEFYEGAGYYYNNNEDSKLVLSDKEVEEGFGTWSHEIITYSII